MTKINATIVADSLSPQGDRLTSLLITFPRIILAEVNTHRMLSKNTSSSRAIPFKKMVKMVEEDPFIPIAWQKPHSGMQGSEYLTSKNHIEDAELEWVTARDWAIDCAERLNSSGTTKQLCNRLLEPFMWTTMLITGSKEGWDNFFELRCPSYDLSQFDMKEKYVSKKVATQLLTVEDKKIIEKWSDLDWLQINKGQAEIHMMALAEAIYDAMNESTPKELKEGEWHIPFGDKIDLQKAFSAGRYIAEINGDYNWGKEQTILNSIKVATARCARLSYMTFDGEIDYEKDIQLHNSLLESHHMSPFEHCARAMSDVEYISFIKGEVETGWFDESEHQIFLSRDDHYFGKYKELGWCRNYKGFIQYRHLIENDYGRII